MARSLIITKPRAMLVDWGTFQTDARAILANIIHELGPVQQIVQNVSLGGRQIRQRASRPVIALGVRTWTAECSILDCVAPEDEVGVDPDYYRYTGCVNTQGFFHCRPGFYTMPIAHLQVPISEMSEFQRRDYNT